MATILTTKIQLRNDLKANWELYNPILLAGEFGVELDTNRFKIGNGVAPWNELSYANTNTTQGEINGSVQEQLDALEKELKDSIALHLPLAGGTLTGDLVLADGAKAISETAVDNKISAALASAGHLKREIVDVLPDVTNADENTIYMVKRTNGSLDIDNYAEYMLINGKFEQIGDTSVDLSNYLTKITNAVAGNIAILNADGTLADGFVAAQDIADHLDNDIIHITAQERTNWNTVMNLVGETPVASQIANALVGYEVKKYEITGLPVNCVADYRDKEIRVFCPENTNWTKQNVGANGDSNMYYMTFKAYAPANAASFKEDDAEIISDQTMYTFENNSSAGIDEYGRKYSVVWLALAQYNEATGTWTYFGKNSKKEKYLGWYYTVEWYDNVGNMISSDQIRINLSNEDCHTDIEPYYMAKVVKSISLNGTLLDVVNNKVEINTNSIFKESEEIAINEDSSLIIKQISASKITTEDGTELVLNGGSAQVFSAQ